MAFLNATSQFRKIVGKMVSYFEDEFMYRDVNLLSILVAENRQITRLRILYPSWLGFVTFRGA